MKPGYCTNIHSGADFQSVVGNLRKFSLLIKKAYCPDEEMGIGLWLSQVAINEALDNDKWQQLNDVLIEHSLVANTFNAFPYSDFHQPVVKHDVYLPNWSDPRRLRYTLDVARLQCRLLQGKPVGSLSTLPLGWPDHGNQEPMLAASAQNIVQCALGLSELSEQFGTRLRLAIEPEPGCSLDTSRKLVDFFDRFLFGGENEALIRTHVGVCHDVCHSAVMFEPQAEALESYRAAGIEIAKIQISSAIACEFQDSETADSQLGALAEFVEPRYLHQTTVLHGEGKVIFFEDLAPAIAAAKSLSFPFSSRTHFHVPIHLEKVGSLRTTRGEVLECLAWVAANRETTGDTDMEVETYAWDVAPDNARAGALIESVVAELRFLDSVVNGKPFAL